MGTSWLLLALTGLTAVDIASAEIATGEDTAAEDTAVEESAAEYTAAAAQPPRAAPLVGMKGEVASLILAGRPGGAFGMSSVALPSLERPGTAEVWLEIDGAELLAAASSDQVPPESPLAVPGQVPAKSPPPSNQEPNDQVPADSQEPADQVPAEDLNLEIYAYALDLHNRVPAFFAARASVDLNDWGELVHATGLRFSSLLQGLPAGTYRLRVLVRLLDSGRFALDQLELRIPNATDSGSALAFSLPATDKGWLRIENPADASSMTPPAALPLLYLAETNNLELFASSELLQRPATARLLRATDKKTITVGEAPLAWTEDSTARAFGRRRSAALKLPALAAGAYWLEIEFANGEVTPRRQVFVLGGELARAATSWPQVLRLAGTVSSTSSKPEDPAVDPDQDPGRLRLSRAYGEVLDLLASGAGNRAGKALTRLERRAAQRHGSPWGPLVQHQQRIHQRLARRQPESLPPIVLLHLEQHDRNARNRRFAFAAANRATLVELTRLYATHSTSEQAQALAARALAALGMYLHAASLWQQGEALLEETLTLDPGNPSARLQLAIFHEAHGRHGRAMNFLRPLAKTTADLEPRVRLAINLRRTDQVAEAESLLRRAIDELGHEANPYLTLAYQELADLYLDEGRDDSAASLLESAIGRIPNSQRLHLQLAFVYDYQGRSSDSRAQMAALSTEAQQTAAEQPSARFLYNRGWQRENRQPRRELEQGARARLSALASALDGENP